MASKLIIAVSGGVDSIVLLHMAARGRLLNGEQMVVAHFDHGIRSDSASDEQFVKELASSYGLIYESEREELGKDASEERARDRRYMFLRKLAKKYDAKIVTAHHADDVVETVAINLIRGTGWRGLGVLDSTDILRPLLGVRKADLLRYARDNELYWREDSTNANTKYLRNDVRQRLKGVDDEAIELLGLYRNRQVAIKHQIDKETERIALSSPYSRHLFISIPSREARELLRSIVITVTGAAETRPQLDRALIAIKTFAPGKRFEINNKATLLFTKTEFVIE